MIIYRYENESGYGPFTFENYVSELTKEQNELLDMINENVDFSIHPTPRLSLYMDFGGFNRFFFGCESKEEISLWFNDDIRFMLNICGFELKVYDCPDEYCVRDQNQIGFIMDEAEDITDDVLV
jgi:hypothetical protein